MRKKKVTTALSFSDVDFTYDPHLPLTLHDISFTIESGTLTAIVGESGSGKSTILRLAASLIAPTLGEVKNDLLTRMVFQNSALLPWLTARENVLFGLLASDLTDTMRERRASSALASVDMRRLEHKYPRDLSGGERQRVGIARAMASEPELLLLDEPFSALDILTTLKLTELIETIRTKNNTTMLMVSHSIENAVQLADRILVCKAGAIIDDVPIPFPHPRPALTPEMMALVKKIKL